MYNFEVLNVLFEYLVSPVARMSVMDAWDTIFYFKCMVIWSLNPWIWIRNWIQIRIENNADPQR
jgi:hypothetical protein